MALLAIVISLFIERAWAAVGEWRSFAWFGRFVARVREGGWGQRWSGTAGVIAVMALPLVAVTVVYVLLGKVFAVLGFAFAVAVLLFCFGPRDLDGDVHRFLNAWEHGDEVRVQEYARGIYEVTGKSYRSGMVARGVVEGILVSAHESWFGVIFWFVVLGPLGALWYRLACVLREICLRRGEEDAFKDAALIMHHILAWIPVRLTLLNYALAGSFADTFEALRSRNYGWMSDWLVNNYSLLIQGGLGALQLDQEWSADDAQVVDGRQVRAALGLVLRTLIFVIILITVVTAGSWAT
jgi:AmpE protein